MLALRHGLTSPAVRARHVGLRDLQQAELAAEARGYTATRHQQEVGTGYFDRVSEIVSGGLGSTLALDESTEAQQF